MSASLPSVAVHATAHRDVTPDRFETVVRLACRSADAAAAARALATGFARVEAAIEALPADLDLVVRRSGVSQRRITWRAGGPGGPGGVGGSGGPEWVAGRQVTLTSGEVERAGSVIAPFAELTGAVDGLELDGPSWYLDRDNPVYAELPAEAVLEALTRARRYAAALGGTLGSLIELADPGLHGPGPGRAMHLASSYAAGGEGFETMDFSPVPITVEVGVEGRWALILP
jgi:hypothetical protein